MKFAFYILLGVFTTAQLVAQTTVITIPPSRFNMHVGAHTLTTSPLLAELSPLDDQSENKKDPAYATYKDGYNAILDERWGEAIKKFAEVKSKYPKSEYMDDAEYWTAFALSHTNQSKAYDAYERFIEKYPKSKYVDDAVADLGTIPSMVTVSGSPDGDSIWTVASATPRAYAYGRGSSMRAAEAQMRRSELMMKRMDKQMSRNFAPPTPHIPPMAVGLPSMTMWDTDRDEKLDPSTRVRLEALYAIGDTKEDETAFLTLKDVALDKGQSIRLRQAAIEVLSDFRKFDVMPIFIELAKKDTNERIQDAAIEFIGQTSKDKNKSVDALVVLFNSMPKSKKEKLETVLYTIADVGNDKAVDFLSTVARTHENYELRSDAVYYLGTIGGEKARTALYQILRNK